MRSMTVSITSINQDGSLFGHLRGGLLHSSYTARGCSWEGRNHVPIIVVDYKLRRDRGISRGRVGTMPFSPNPAPLETSFFLA